MKRASKSGKPRFVRISDELWALITELASRIKPEGVDASTYIRWKMMEVVDRELPGRWQEMSLEEIVQALRKEKKAEEGAAEAGASQRRKRSAK